MKTYILRIIFLILIITNSLIIFGFSAQNGEESSNLSKTVITKIADIFNVEENRESFLNIGESVIRKLAHFSIYTLLGIWVVCFMLTFKIKLKWQITLTAVWGLLYAITDEFHQMFSSGRHASINDVVIDTLGVLFGLFLVLTINKIIEIIKQKKLGSKYKSEKIKSPNNN